MASAGGDGRADGERCGAGAGAEGVLEFVEAGAGEGGDAQEEGQAGGGDAVEVEDEGGGDGGAGAGEAGEEEGEDLGGADEHGVLEGGVVLAAFVAALLAPPTALRTAPALVTAVVLTIAVWSTAEAAHDLHVLLALVGAW